MDKVTIYHFTDPMMRLSYESEPFFRQLETHFGDQVELKFVMGGLVRDVADFMIADDFRDGKEKAFSRYNARLAKIYESEQMISGMPIKMDKFCLFSEKNRSSIPLNLAFKAVEIINPKLAERFLYRLRFATIVEQRITTNDDELAQITVESGIDKASFLKVYQSDTVKLALQNDFKLRAKLGINALPAYLFCYGNKQVLKTGVLNFIMFSQIISSISDGTISPQAPIINSETLRNFLSTRELISLTEIRYAFNLIDNQSAVDWLEKMKEQPQWIDMEFIKYG